MRDVQGGDALWPLLVRIMAALAALLWVAILVGRDVPRRGSNGWLAEGLVLVCSPPGLVL